MAPSAANKDEAARCLKIAAKYLAEGNRERAAKFLAKSKDLYPLPEAERLQARLDGKDESPTRTQAAAGAAAGNTFRQRRTVSSPSSPSTQDSKPADEPPRNFTSEQLSIVRKINSIKCLYKRLDVARDADGSTIKKAYRKIAMKVHPDKNTAPGAEDAFKAVNKAFEVLSDPTRRRQYDVSGEESPAPQVTRGPQFHNARDFEAELLRQFFGFDFAEQRGPRRRSPRQHQHQHQQRDPRFTRMQAETDRLPIGYLLMMLGIFVISILSQGLVEPPEAAYSLTREGKYNIERHVPGTNVKYFVADSFANTYMANTRKSRQYLRDLEQEIEQSYYNELQRRCNEERRAARKKGQKRDRIPACERLNDFTELYKEVHNARKTRRY